MQNNCKKNLHKLTDRSDYVLTLYLQLQVVYSPARAWTKVSNPDTIVLEAVRLHLSFGSYCPLVPFARTYDSTRQVTRCEVTDFRFFKVQIKTLVASYFERNNRFSLPPITPVDLTRRFPTGAKMNVQQKRKCQLNEKFSFQASFKSKILQSCFFCNLFIFWKNTWDWEHEVVIYCSYIAKYLRVAGPVGFCHK